MWTAPPLSFFLSFRLTNETLIGQLSFSGLWTCEQNLSPSLCSFKGILIRRLIARYYPVNVDGVPATAAALCRRLTIRLGAFVWFASELICVMFTVRGQRRCWTPQVISDRLQDLMLQITFLVSSDASFFLFLFLMFLILHFDVWTSSAAKVPPHIRHFSLLKTVF